MYAEAMLDTFYRRAHAHETMLRDEPMARADSQLVIQSTDCRLSSDGRFFVGSITMFTDTLDARDEVVAEIDRLLDLGALPMEGNDPDILDIFTVDDVNGLLVHAVYMYENEGYSSALHDCNSIAF